ncbi:hypothetical protein CMI42_02665 [Candidatus Pacearchaeota archaeon]|nr:hypothetical protein [Candidatus Pacearchaeota archaeon]|tara:strand:- start:1321 stop:1623 length:303 start_codon:yes stop_codon:yes gene_type:complete
MTKTITTRLPDDFVFSINELAKKENLDVSAVIRRLLADALKKKKQEEVLHLLSENRISVGKAAEELKMSIWDILDIARDKNINWTNYEESDLKKDRELLR